MTTVTAIWNDCFCDGLSEHHVEQVELDLTPDEIREMPPEDIIRLAMPATLTDEEVAEALKDYGLVGIALGTIEWLH